MLALHRLCAKEGPTAPRRHGDMPPYQERQGEEPEGCSIFSDTPTLTFCLLAYGVPGVISLSRRCDVTKEMEKLTK